MNALLSLSLSLTCSLCLVFIPLKSCGCYALTLLKTTLWTKKKIFCEIYYLYINIMGLSYYSDPSTITVTSECALNGSSQFVEIKLLQALAANSHYIFTFVQLNILCAKRRFCLNNSNEKKKQFFEVLSVRAVGFWIEQGMKCRTVVVLFRVSFGRIKKWHQIIWAGMLFMSNVPNYFPAKCCRFSRIFLWCFDWMTNHFLHARYDSV